MSNNSNTERARTNDLHDKLQFTICGNDAGIKQQESRVVTTAVNNTRPVSRSNSNHLPKRFETKRPLISAAPRSLKSKSDFTSNKSKSTMPTKNTVDTIKDAIRSNAVVVEKISDEKSLRSAENVAEPTPVGDEMDDLKREVSNLKEIVASLMINSNSKAVDYQDPTPPNSQSKNDIICPRCNFLFDLPSCERNKRTSSVPFPQQSGNPHKNSTDENSTNGASGMSIIESQFRMTVFDRKSRDNVQSNRRQCDDDDFLREMIGVAEVWGRDRKVNRENENCYEQFRIMRHVSNTNKEFSSHKTQPQLEALLNAADRNPNLKKKLETLAMHYLPDSQLTRIAAVNAPPESNRDNSERKMLEYPKKFHRARSDAVKSRPNRLEFEEPEQNDEELFSLCSQKYLQRHGLLPKSSLSSFDDDSLETNVYDRRSHNVLNERNGPEYSNDFRNAKFIEVEDDDDDFLTIHRH